MCNQNDERAYDIIRRCKELFNKELVFASMDIHYEVDFVDKIHQDIDDFIDDTRDQDTRIVLGGCYHSGLAYSLAYDANGEIELAGRTFTNLSTGLDGGAMGALNQHRRDFDPDRDVPCFIVALKPVKVILGREDGEDYKLPDTIACDSCKKEQLVKEDETCVECVDEDIFDECCYSLDECICGEQCSECHSFDCVCDTCPDCGWLYEDCTCDGYDRCRDGGCRCDEFFEEFIADAPPMNAFDRARWNKANKK
jgi:hypothetical protein